MGLILGLLAGCGSGVTGTPVTPDPSTAAPAAGLLFASDSDGDGMVLLDRAGTVRRTVEVSGLSGPARVLPEGRLLVESDAGLAIIDTRSGVVTPVTFDRPDDAEDLNPYGMSSPVPRVDVVAGKLLLGTPRGNRLGLIDLATGKGVSLDALLEPKFLQSASLDPTGSWVTMVSDKGVAVVSTADPTEIRPVIPDATIATGAISVDGGRFTALVGERGAKEFQVFTGRPGGTATDTGRRARIAVPLPGDALWLQDGKANTVVDAAGKEHPIDGLGPTPRMVAESARMLLLATESGRSVLVTFGDGVTVTTLDQDLSELRAIRSFRPGGDSFVLVPSRPDRAATELTVVDPEGVRTVQVDPFDTTTAVRLDGDRVALTGQDGRTSTVVDLTTGKPVRTLEGSASVWAPDGSAVVVRTDDGQQIVPIDGSDPVDLGERRVVAWATA